MSKITIKHYLNVNLKPYKINGEDKYNIYVLIINQKNSTKIKSSIFQREFSESEFLELKESDFENEKFILENLVNVVNSISGFFDTNLLTILLKQLTSLPFELISNKYPIWYKYYSEFKYKDRITGKMVKNFREDLSISEYKDYEDKKEDIFINNDNRFFLEIGQIKFYPNVAIDWFSKDFQSKLNKQIDFNPNYEKKYKHSEQNEYDTLIKKNEILIYVNKIFAFVVMDYTYKNSKKLSKDSIVLDIYKSKFNGYYQVN